MSDVPNYLLTNHNPALMSALANYQGGLQQQQQTAVTNSNLAGAAQDQQQSAITFQQGQEDRAAGQQAASAAAQRNAEAQTAMVALAQNPNATAQDYIAFMAQYPEIRDAAKSQWDMLDAARQEGTQKDLLQMYAALGNDPAAAKQMLEDRLTAAKNSGDIKTIKETMAALKMLDANPGALRTAIGLQLAGSMGAEHFATTLDAINPQAKGPEWRAATPEEAATYGATGGQINTTTGEFDPINPPSGFSVTTGPGGTQIIQGPGVGKPASDVPDFTAGQAMIDNIDGVLSDPALPNATGLLSFMQSIPGTGAYRFGTRVRQITGQAFLQAYKTLKGGGQITEIEGKKATEAIGRLDSAQSPADYKAALSELRQLLVDAQTSAQQAGTGATGKVYDIGPAGEGFNEVPKGGKFRLSDGTTGVKQ